MRMQRMLAIGILGCFCLVMAIAEEKAPERAKGSKGTIIGELTKKDGGNITVKSDTETMKLSPYWRGGLPKDGGGFDKEMMKRLEGFKVGSKVKVTWTLEERYRIDTIDKAE